MTVVVRIQHTALTFLVEADESILAAALRQNVYLPWGCGTGICGTCMGQVVSGTVRYPDGLPLALFESDAELGKVLLCTAHAITDLVLSLPELT